MNRAVVSLLLVSCAIGLAPAHTRADSASDSWTGRVELRGMTGTATVGEITDVEELSDQTVVAQKI